MTPQRGLGGGTLGPVTPTRLAFGLRDEAHGSLGRTQKAVAGRPSWLGGGQPSAAPGLAWPVGMIPEFQAFAPGTAAGTAWGLSAPPPPPLPSPSLSAQLLGGGGGGNLAAGGAGRSEIRGGKNLFLSQPFKRKPSSNPESWGFLLCRAVCFLGCQGPGWGWK